MPALPADFEVQALRPKRKFVPGKSPGRPKGAVGRIVRDLKNGCLEAASNLGRFGSGEGGLVGYLEYLGAEHPKAFASLLGKILPLQIHADVNSAAISQVRIVSVPADCYLSAEQISKINSGEPMTIDAQPAPIVQQLEPVEPPARFEDPTIVEVEMSPVEEPPPKSIDESEPESEPTDQYALMRKRAIASAAWVPRAPNIARKLPRKPSWDF